VKRSLFLSLILVFIGAAAAQSEFVTISNENVIASVDDLSGRFTMSTTGPRGTTNTRQILQEKLPPTSITAIRIDDLQTTYGGYEGNFSRRPYVMNPDIIVSEWKCRGVTFMQVVQLVRGNYTGRKDTIRISYLIFNFSGGERKIGIEMLLDTYMGEKDDVHYTLPSGEEILNESEFSGAALPDFWYALDNIYAPTLAILSTMRHPMLVVPDRLFFGTWKRMYDELFDIEPSGKPLGVGSNYDSAVGIFYNSRVIPDEGSTFFSKMFGLYETNRVRADGLSVSVTAPAVSTDRRFRLFADLSDIAGAGFRNVPVKLILPPELRLASDSRIPAEWKIPGILSNDTTRLEYSVEMDDSIQERTEAVVRFEALPEGSDTPVRYDRRVILDPKGSSIQADIVTRVMENLEDKKLNLSNDTILEDKSIQTTLAVAQEEVKSNDLAVALVIALETNTNAAPSVSNASVSNTNAFIPVPETNVIAAVVTNKIPPETNIAPAVVITTNLPAPALPEWEIPETRVDFGSLRLSTNGLLTPEQTAILDSAVSNIRREAVGRRIEVIGRAAGGDFKQQVTAGLLAEKVYGYLAGKGALPSFKLKVRVTTGGTNDIGVVDLHAEQKEAKE
jgi:hypothetical protein